MFINSTSRDKSHLKKTAVPTLMTHLQNAFDTLCTPNSSSGTVPHMDYGNHSSSNSANVICDLERGSHAETIATPSTQRQISSSLKRKVNNK